MGRINVLLDVKNSVLRIHGSLILSSLTNEALLVGKRDIRRRGEVSLLIGDLMKFCQYLHFDRGIRWDTKIGKLTNFDICAVIVGNTGVGGTFASVSNYFCSDR